MSSPPSLQLQSNIKTLMDDYFKPETTPEQKKQIENKLGQKLFAKKRAERSQSTIPLEQGQSSQLTDDSQPIQLQEQEPIQLEQQQEEPIQIEQQQEPIDEVEEIEENQSITNSNNTIELNKKLEDLNIEYKKLLEIGLSQHEKIRYKVLFQKIVSELQKDISLREIRDYLIRYYKLKAINEKIATYNVDFYALAQAENDINFLYSYFEKYYDIFDEKKGEIKLRLKKEYTYTTNEDIRDITIKIRKEQIDYVKPVVTNISDKNNVEIIFDKEYDTFKKKHFITEEQSKEQEEKAKEAQKRKEKLIEQGEFVEKKSKKEIKKELSKEEYERVEIDNVIYQKRNNAWEYISNVLENNIQIKPEQELYYQTFKKAYYDSSLVPRIATDDNIHIDFVQRITNPNGANYFLDQNSSIETRMKQNKTFYTFEIVITDKTIASKSTQSTFTEDLDSSIVQKDVKKTYSTEFYQSLKNEFFTRNIYNDASGIFDYSYDNGIEPVKTYEIKFNRINTKTEDLNDNSRVLGSISRFEFQVDDYTQYQLTIDYELRHLFGSYDLKTERRTLYPINRRLLETAELPWIGSENVKLADLDILPFTYSFKDKVIKPDNNIFVNCLCEFFIETNVENQIKQTIFIGVIEEMISSFVFNIKTFSRDIENDMIKIQIYENINVNQINKIWKKPNIPNQINSPILLDNESYSFIYPDPNATFSKSFIKTTILNGVYETRPVTSKFDAVFVDEYTLQYEELQDIELFKGDIAKSIPISKQNPLLELYSNIEGRTYYISYNIFKIFVCNQSKKCKQLEILLNNVDKNPIIQVDTQLYVLGRQTNPNVKNIIQGGNLIKKLDDIIFPIESYSIMKIRNLLEKCKKSVEYNSEQRSKSNQEDYYQMFSGMLDDIQTYFELFLPVYTTFISNEFIYDFSEKDKNDFDEYQTRYDEIIQEIYRIYKTIVIEDEKIKLKKHIYMTEYIIQSINELYYYIRFETLKNMKGKNKRTKKGGNFQTIISTTLEDIIEVYEDIDINQLNKCLLATNDNKQINQIYKNLPSLLDLLYQIDGTKTEKNLLSLKTLNDPQLEILISKFGYHSPKVYTYQLLQSLFQYNKNRYLQFLKKTYIPFSYNKLLEFDCNEIKYDKEKLRLFYQSILQVQNKTTRNDLLNKFIDNYAILIKKDINTIVYKVPYRNKIVDEFGKKKLDINFLSIDGNELEICIHDKYIANGDETKFKELILDNGTCANCGQQISEIEFDTQEGFADDDEGVTESTRETSTLIGKGKEAVGLNTIIDSKLIQKQNPNLLSNFLKEEIYIHYLKTIIEPDSSSKSFIPLLPNKNYQRLNRDIFLREFVVDNVKDHLIIFENYQSEFELNVMKFDYITIRNEFMLPLFKEHLEDIHSSFSQLFSDLLLLSEHLNSNEQNLETIGGDFIKILTYKDTKKDITNLFNFICKPNAELKQYEIYRNFNTECKLLIFNYINEEIRKLTGHYMDIFKGSINNLDKNIVMNITNLIVDKFLLNIDDPLNPNVSLLSLNDLSVNYERNLESKLDKLYDKYRKEKTFDIKYKSKFEDFIKSIKSIKKGIINILDKLNEFCLNTLNKFSTTPNYLYNYCIDNRNILFILITYFYTKNPAQYNIWLDVLGNINNGLIKFYQNTKNNERYLKNTFFNKFVNFILSKKGKNIVKTIKQETITSNDANTITHFSIYNPYDDLSVYAKYQNKQFGEYVDKYISKDYLEIGKDSETPKEFILSCQANKSISELLDKNDLITLRKIIEMMFGELPKKLTEKTLIESTIKYLSIVSIFHPIFSLSTFVNLDENDMRELIETKDYEKLELVPYKDQIEIILKSSLYGKNEQYNLLSLIIDSVFKNIVSKILDKYYNTNIIFSCCFFYLQFHYIINIFNKYVNTTQLNDLYKQLIVINKTEDITLESYIEILKNIFTNFADNKSLSNIENLLNEYEKDMKFDVNELVDYFKKRYMPNMSKGSSLKSEKSSFESSKDISIETYKGISEYDTNKFDEYLAHYRIIFYEKTNIIDIDIRRRDYRKKYLIQFIRDLFKYERKNTSVSTMKIESKLNSIVDISNIFRETQKYNVSIHSYIKIMLSYIKELSVDLYLFEINTHIRELKLKQLNQKEKEIREEQDISINVNVSPLTEISCVNPNLYKYNMVLKSGEKYVEITQGQFNKELPTIIEFIQYLNLLYLQSGIGITKQNLIEMSKSNTIKNEEQENSSKSETNSLPSQSVSFSSATTMSSLSKGKSKVITECDKLFRTQIQELMGMKTTEEYNSLNNVLNYKYFYNKIIELNKVFQFQYFHYLSNLFNRRRQTLTSNNLLHKYLKFVIQKFFTEKIDEYNVIYKSKPYVDDAVYILTYFIENIETQKQATEIASYTTGEITINYKKQLLNFGLSYLEMNGILGLQANYLNYYKYLEFVDKNKHYLKCLDILFDKKIYLQLVNENVRGTRFEYLLDSKLHKEAYKNILYIDFYDLIQNVLQIHNENFNYEDILNRYMYDVISQEKDISKVLEEFLNNLTENQFERVIINTQNLNSVYKNILEKQSINHFGSSDISILSKIMGISINEVVDTEKVKLILQSDMDMLDIDTIKLFNKKLIESVLYIKPYGEGPCGSNKSPSDLLKCVSFPKFGFSHLSNVFDEMRDFISYISRYMDLILTNYDPKYDIRGYKDRLFKHDEESKNQLANDYYKQMIDTKNRQLINKINFFKVLFGIELNSSVLIGVKNEIMLFVYQIASKYKTLERELTNEKLMNRITPKVNRFSYLGLMQNLLYMFYYQILSLDIRDINEFNNSNPLLYKELNIETLDQKGKFKLLLLFAFVEYQISKQMIISEIYKKGDLIRKEIYQITGDHYMASLYEEKQKKIGIRTKTEMIDYTSVEKEVQESLIENANEKVEMRALELQLENEEALLNADRSQRQNLAGEGSINVADQLGTAMDQVEDYQQEFDN